MDDQPKEGGEGDKKIVHTYALVKVNKIETNNRNLIHATFAFMFNFL